MNFPLVFILSLFLTVTAYAQNKKVAVVKLLRGDVSAIISGKTSKLKVEDWVEDGSVVKTADKSFVKLIFLDKSSMNIGPGSEMKIEKFSGKDSGVIDLVKGKIRSQVTKDYLQIQDKDKSKLFIKTKNAVMGVRGTDFMISTNGTNTATVLFEGEIVLNNLTDHNITNTQVLEQTVNAGVRIVPGEFSVVDAGSAPTVPSLLNVGQLEKLERNPNFSTDSRTPNSSASDTRTVVPPGLTGESVSNKSDTLKNAVSEVVVSTPASTPVSSTNANGFSNDSGVKPTNGSFVHIDSGVIIPPAAGSVLDRNTNTYIAPSTSGTVANDGSYVPPKDVQITNSGQVLVTVTNSSGQQIQKEIPKPSPVAASAAVLNPVAGVAPSTNSIVAISVQPPKDPPAVGPGSPFTPTFNNPNVPPPTAGVTPTNDPAVVSHPNIPNSSSNAHVVVH
jgi:hypothetical protein